MRSWRICSLMFTPLREAVRSLAAQGYVEVGGRLLLVAPVAGKGLGYLRLVQAQRDLRKPLLGIAQTLTGKLLLGSEARRLAPRYEIQHRKHDKADKRDGKSDHKKSFHN